ncbi:MAG: hypothetical protein JNL96_25170 [Planctomycetaceae bacterium]|nr:hypothetical protein [Planctomycetaceae bacterium]
MIIFIDEAAAERRWLKVHRGAVVVEYLGRRGKPLLVVHGASCDRLKKQARRGRDRRLICSAEPGDALQWCRDQFSAEPVICDACGGRSAAPASPHLSRAARDILDYVLDVAVIHLEPEAKPYRLTIAEIAQCLQKTPGRLAAPLRTLQDAGLITIAVAPRHASEIVYPTPDALRTLPYFAPFEAPLLEIELAKLRAPGKAATST